MSAESNDKRGKAAVFSLPVISKIKNEYDLFCTEANANLNFKEFFEGQKKREKSLFLEFLRLRSKYGASVEDYLLYEFYRKSNREINTYITFKRRGQLYRAADKKDSLHYFGNKKDFFEKFGRYMQQDCIFAADEKDKDTFVRFCEGKDEIVIKPVWGSGDRACTDYPYPTKKMSRRYGMTISMPTANMKSIGSFVIARNSKAFTLNH